MRAFESLRNKIQLEVDDLRLMVLLKSGGSAFYEELAEKASHPVASDLLRRNSWEDRIHAHRLKRAIEVLTGNEYVIPTPEENPFSNFAAVPVCSRTILEIIEYIENECAAHQSRWADHAPHPDVAALLRQNSSEDQLHGERVRQVIEILHRSTGADPSGA